MDRFEVSGDAKKILFDCKYIFSTWNVLSTGHKAKLVYIALRQTSL